MKKFLFFCLMGLVSMMSFTACGDDEDESILDEGGKEQVEASKPELKDNGNQLILTYTMKAPGTSVNVTWTADFQNNLCVSSVQKMVYSSERIAQLSYEEYLKDGNADNVSINGKTLTLDTTSEFAGMQKEVVRAAMEAMAAHYSK